MAIGESCPNQLNGLRLLECSQPLAHCVAILCFKVDVMKDQSHHRRFPLPWTTSAEACFVTDGAQRQRCRRDVNLGQFVVLFMMLEMLVMVSLGLLCELLNQ